MSISSYAEIFALCELSVIFFICFLISLENLFISSKYGKKHMLWAVPVSDVSISAPNNIHTLSLYIIPPSSISYASPDCKKFSISSITYGDAESIIPATCIPFLSAHSFAILAKLRLPASSDFYWFTILTSSNVYV